MSIVHWEPFSEMVSLREAMDRLVEESVIRPRAGISNGEVLALPLDIYQTANDIVIRAAVPGVRPEDIDINVLGDTLTIKGEYAEQRPEQAGYYLRELRRGHFARSVTLPMSVNADGAQASFENGMLNLRLPKAESARPRQIKISSSPTAG